MKRAKRSPVSDTKFWCDLRRVKQSPEKILSTILDRLAAVKNEPPPPASETARPAAPKKKRLKPSKEEKQRSIQLEYSAIDLLDEINERASQQANDKVSVYLVANRGTTHLWHRARNNDQVSVNLLAKFAI